MSLELRINKELSAEKAINVKMCVTYAAWYRNNYQMNNDSIKEVIESINRNNSEIGNFISSELNESIDTETQNALFMNAVNYSVEELSDYFKSLVFSNNIYLQPLITENAICEFISNIIPAAKDKSVLDLCSGIGNLLAFYGKTGAINLTGIEINKETNAIAQMNLSMNGIKADILLKDALAEDINTKYDIVITDFPWGLRTRNAFPDFEDFGITMTRRSRNIDWLFMLKAISLTKKNGKTVAITSERPLISLQEKEIRKYLVENGLIETIIAMPRGTRNHTAVSYYVIVFSEGNDDIKYIDGTEAIIKWQREKKIDVGTLVGLVNSPDSEKVMELSKEEIIDNDYSLDLRTYHYGRDIQLVNPKDLGSLAEVFRGYQATPKNSSEIDPDKAEYLVVKVSDIKDGKIDSNGLSGITSKISNLEKYVLKPNDIIINTRGTSGTPRAAIFEGKSEKKLIPFGNISVIRVKEEEILPKYLLTFLNGVTGQELLRSICDGAVVYAISRKKLAAMKIAVLDMDTQETIVNRYNILKKRKEQLLERVEEINRSIGLLYEEEVGE